MRPLCPRPRPGYNSLRTPDQLVRASISGAARRSSLQKGCHLRSPSHSFLCWEEIPMLKADAKRVVVFLGSVLGLVAAASGCGGSDSSKTPSLNATLAAQGQ